MAARDLPTHGSAVHSSIGWSLDGSEDNRKSTRKYGKRHEEFEEDEVQNDSHAERRVGQSMAADTSQYYGPLSTRPERSERQ